MFAENAQQEVAVFIWLERGRYYDVVARCQLMTTDHFAGVDERRTRDRRVVFEEILVERTRRLGRRLQRATTLRIINYQRETRQRALQNNTKHENKCGIEK